MLATNIGYRHARFAVFERRKNPQFGTHFHRTFRSEFERSVQVGTGVRSIINQYSYETRLYTRFNERILSLRHEEKKISDGCRLVIDAAVNLTMIFLLHRLHST